MKKRSRAYTTDLITAKRDELGTSILDALTEDLSRYHIIIDGVFVSDIGLPTTYTDAVNEKLIQTQNVQTEIQKANSAKEKAIGDANAIREKASGDAEALTTLATAQAAANEAINASLTEALIRWQAIQKLNPNVNVMMVPSDQGLLFNLDGSTLTSKPQVSPAP